MASLDFGRCCSSVLFLEMLSNHLRLVFLKCDGAVENCSLGEPHFSYLSVKQLLMDIPMQEIKVICVGFSTDLCGD